MSDATTTIATIKQMVFQYREDRDWNKYSNLHDLTAALSIETGELFELFLWKTAPEIQERIATDARYKERISEELADVVFCVLAISLATKIDLTDAITKKIAKNCLRYPVNEVKGNAIDKGMTD